MSIENDLIDTGNIQVEVTVRLGRTFKTVSQLAGLQPNAIIALDQSIDDGVEICVGDIVIARGILTDGSSGDNRLHVCVTGSVR